jgi:hypothetical protein
MAALSALFSVINGGRRRAPKIFRRMMAINRAPQHLVFSANTDDLPAIRANDHIRRVIKRHADFARESAAWAVDPKIAVAVLIAVEFVLQQITAIA